MLIKINVHKEKGRGQRWAEGELRQGLSQHSRDLWSRSWLWACSVLSLPLLLDVACPGQSMSLRRWLSTLMCTPKELSAFRKSLKKTLDVSPVASHLIKSYSISPYSGPQDPNQQASIYFPDLIPTHIALCSDILALSLPPQHGEHLYTYLLSLFLRALASDYALLLAFHRSPSQCGLLILSWFIFSIALCLFIHFCLSVPKM